jgi:hypothetical protein
MKELPQTTDLGVRQPPKYIAFLHDAQSPGNINVDERANTFGCEVAIERDAPGMYRLTPSTPGLFARMPFVTVSPIVQNDPTIIVTPVFDSNYLPNALDFYIWAYQLTEAGDLRRSAVDGFLDNLCIQVELV